MVYEDLTLDLILFYIVRSELILSLMLTTILEGIQAKLLNITLQVEMMLTTRKSSKIVACLDAYPTVIGRVMVPSIEIASPEKLTKGEPVFQRWYLGIFIL